jgi:hypothetical protein
LIALMITIVFYLFLFQIIWSRIGPLRFIKDLEVHNEAVLYLRQPREIVTLLSSRIPENRIVDDESLTLSQWRALFFLLVVFPFIFIFFSINFLSMIVDIVV